MKTAAAIGWRPSEFWAATPHELLAAIDGWNLAQGNKEALREEREEEFAAFKAGLERVGVSGLRPQASGLKIDNINQGRNCSLHAYKK